MGSFVLQKGCNSLDMILRILPPCLFHRLTGLYCPGCGGTRSIYALLTGRIGQSLYYHPIIIYTVVCFLWYYAKVTIQKVSRQKYILYMPQPELLLKAAAVLVVLNCLIRNLMLLIGGITLSL